MMSTGLACGQLAGRQAFKASSVCGAKVARFPPASCSASAASTPAPPPLVRMASRSPRKGRAWARVSAASNSASSVSTRSMPARRKAASSTTSEPASAPVCEAAARAPEEARPALTTMTGLLRAAWRAADMNLRAALMDSAYIRIARVEASQAR